MKYFIATILLGLLYGNCYCQNSDDTTILENKNALQVDKLVVAKNTTFHNTSTITIADSLLVFGTLINDGTITAKNCIVTNGTLKANAYNSLIVDENLTFINATTTSNDTTHIVTFSAKNIIIDGYTKMESAYLTTQNLIINDTLEFTGKLGVKKITSDFILNGIFLNTDNENIQLYGNLINNNKQTCTKANFELLGENKAIHGNFSCYRLDLENQNTIYTNYDSLTVTDGFAGKGTLIQNENAFLSVKTTTTPQIIASANGNTVEYATKGKQYLNTTECYNLSLQKSGGASLFLTKDCKVSNKLIINKKSFLDCGNHKLSVNQIDTVNETFNKDRGIFLRKGKISIETLQNNESISIPLFTTDTSFAEITITNLDESEKSITIDSLFNFVTETGISNAPKIQQEFINTCWHLTSDLRKAQIRLEWDSKAEQDLFDSENSAIYQSFGTSWKNISKQDTKSTIHKGKTEANGYFTIGNAGVLLAIDLEHFTINSHNNENTISWKSSSIKTPFVLEKSFDGINFHTTKSFEISTNGEYHYTDFSQTKNVYYRLRQENPDGTFDYSDIKFIGDKNSDTIKISEDEIQYIGNEHITILELYNLRGEKVCVSNKKTMSTNGFSKGVYLLKIQKEHSTSVQKINL